MIARHVFLRAACGICVIGAMELSAVAALAATQADDSTQIDVNRGTINLDQPTSKAALERAPMGNPLWAIPLGSLSITRDRPLFTPSRRPPPPAVVAMSRVEPVRPSPARPPEPEHPHLSLVGTVIGTTEGIGVFLDQTTNKVLRLKIGEQHAGWVLRSVRGRQVTLDKDHKTETLAFPMPAATAQSAKKIVTPDEVPQQNNESPNTWMPEEMRRRR